MTFRANFPAFWLFGRRPLALLRRAKIGNLHEISCGNDFANMKHPSCRANKTQLQALRKSQKNSSNLLQRFWAVSIDSGIVWRKRGEERGPNRSKFRQFLEPDWCREILKFLKGHGAVPLPNEVRCLEETRHRAEIAAMSGA